MMPNPETHVFELPWNVRSDKILAGLSDIYTTTADAPPARRERVLYFDTFDWRLFNRGLALVQSGAAYELRDTDNTSALDSCTVHETPSFWWEFPKGGLQKRLHGVLKERAVVVVGEVALRSRNVRVLNTDRKTVARVSIQTGEAFNKGRAAARIRLLTVIPLRGYAKEARQLARDLSVTGLRPAKKSIFAMAVAACGREPGDYTSKLAVELDRTMSARQAAAVIFGHLLDTMERNVDGIRKDTDTEFLHDFRVAIRRTRSGLSQLKKALPGSVTKRFSRDFADLGRGTNRLRDLDVYLLSRGHYEAMLNEDLRPGLDPLFANLAEERRTHHESLVRLVDGREYLTLVREWRRTLRDLDASGPDGEGKDTPVENLARTVIGKRFERVLRRGRIIERTTPDEALHTLRIDCKKLRYMLEFFASLYPAREIADFIKQLKRLQDNLGDFNDLSFQQIELNSFLKGMRKGTRLTTAAAVGALIAKLEYRQRDVRGQFAATFDAFAAAENRRRFKRLFKHRQK